MKIIVDIAGGFGNQLFTYAFGYALAKEKKAELVLDTTMQDSGIAREYELGYLDIKYDERISWNYKKDFLNRALINKIRKKKAIGIKTNIYIEKNPTIFEPQVFEIKNATYFKGNWQSEKYFSKYRDDLLRIFKPKEIRSKSVINLQNKLREENSVALHVRRGDYVNIGCNLEMDYYEMALDKILAVVQNPIFYVFSDDVEFCKQYFAKYPNLNIQYPRYDSDNYTLDDLLLMSSCKHNIIANSSFSWWAAWLNENSNKIVVCPKLAMWRDDFYPDNWFRIKLD